MSSVPSQHAESTAAATDEIAAKRKLIIESLRSGVEQLSKYPTATNPQSAFDALELLNSEAGQVAHAAAEHVRMFFVRASGNASLNVSSQREQKTIYGIYEGAKLGLAALDHADWRPCLRAWQASGAVFNEKLLKDLEAIGGYRAVHASPTLRAEWQDVLDHVLQHRFYEVRYDLMGPAKANTTKATPLIHFQEEGCLFVAEAEFEQIGAGANVAAVNYVVYEEGKRPVAQKDRHAAALLVVQDRMALAPDAFALFLRRSALEALELRRAYEQSRHEWKESLREVIDDDLAVMEPKAAGYREAAEQILSALQTGGVAPETFEQALQSALEGARDCVQSLEVGHAPRP